jgi:hypothetical protein
MSVKKKKKIEIFKLLSEDIILFDIVSADWFSTGTNPKNDSFIIISVTTLFE